MNNINLLKNKKNVQNLKGGGQKISQYEINETDEKPRGGGPKYIEGRM